MQISRTTTAALLALCLSGCGADAAGEAAGDSVTSTDQEGAVGGEASGPASFDAVIAAARRERPAGTPIEVEREQVAGAMLLEVELLEGDTIAELYFDPTTGELVRQGEEHLSAAEQAALPALREALAQNAPTLEEALALARQHYGDEEMHEVELELHEGRLVLEVAIERNGRREIVLHDVQSGERIGEETGSEHEE